MNYDQERIDAAVAALKQCSEAEALAAVCIYEQFYKRGPGRPRGSRNKPKPEQAELIIANQETTK